MQAKKFTYALWRASYEQVVIQLGRRRQDHEIEKRAGRVIYALDNDVITLVTAPWRTAHQNYLRLFGAEDLEAVEALAHVLAEFFLCPTGSLPYVVVRPAELELEGMWNYVHSQALGEKAELAAGVENLLRDTFPGSEKALFDLVKRALEIVYGRSGALTELKRIARLAELGAIRRMDTVLDEHGRSPFPMESEADAREMLHLEKLWLNKLNQSRPKNVREGGADDVPRNNLIDAAVLARIQWINLKYQEEGLDTRLCLITGDSHIEKVASEIGSDGKSFAEKFIRTPTCFLDDDKFLKGLTSKSQQRSSAVALPTMSLGECLSVLSAAAQDGISEFLSRKSEKQIIDEMQHVVEQWKRFIKSVAASSQLDSKQFAEALNHHLAARAHIKVNEVRRWYERLKDKVILIGDEALARFGASGALAAFWSLDYRNRRVERSIPPVKFNSLKVAQSFLGQLRDAASFQELQKAVSEKWISELRGEDESGYTSLIVFSLAHASAAEWHTALTVARAAVLAAKALRERNPLQTIKGDEAAYLCAVFSRLSARDMRSLEKAEEWVERAKELQRLVPIRASLADIDMQTYEDPRFVAERLAIRLCKRLFAELEDSRQRELSDLLATTWGIADECNKFLKLECALEFEPSASVRRYVKEQVSVNFLQWQLLAACRSERDPILNAESRRFLELLQDGFERVNPPIANEETGSFLGRSRLVYFIYLCATAVFAPDLAGWGDPSIRLQLINSMDRAGAALRVMPYDELRVKRFSSIAKHSVGIVQ